MRIRLIITIAIIYSNRSTVKQGHCTELQKQNMLQVCL